MAAGSMTRRRAVTPMGVLAGLAGGLAGAWAMNRFQSLLTRAFGGPSNGRSEDEDATERLAQSIAAHTIARPLSKDELDAAGPVVHYAYGTVMGGLYGAVAEQFDTVSPLGGATYGALLWAAGDEVAVPLFGLSRSSTEFSFGTHVQALAAHLVYGVTADLVRRGILAAV